MVYSLLLPLAVLCMNASCTVNPLESKVSDTTLAMLTPKTVSDLCATINDPSSITVTFNGQSDMDDYQMYYTLSYALGPDFDDTKEVVITPARGVSAISYTFSSLPAGTQMLVWVTTHIAYAQTSGSKKVLESTSSAVVEGATLPAVSLYSVMEGSTVNLYWSADALYSALDPTGNTPLYPNYTYTLKRISGTTEKTVYEGNKKNSFTETVAGNAVSVTYTLTLSIKDAAGASLSDDPITSTLMVTTDSSSEPEPAEELTASGESDILKDAVMVRWTLPDYISTVKNPEYRVILERSVHGAGEWTKLIDKGTAINNDTYAYTKLDEEGRASYAYKDGSVLSNTLYDYRITTYYLVNGANYIRQDKDIVPTAAGTPGFKVWLPTDFAVTNTGTAVGTVDGSGNYPVTANLAWKYGQSLPLGMQFVVVRSDEYATVKLSGVTEKTLQDSFTLEPKKTDYDTRFDHTYHYSIMLDYGDGTTSEVLAAPENVIYTTSFEKVDYITDWSVTTDLSKKIILSWKLNLISSKGNDLSLEKEKLSYTLQESDTLNGRTDATVLLDSTDATQKDQFVFDETAQTYTITLDREGGTKKYYRLTAKYSDAGNATYDGTTTVVLPVGSTLGVPRNLTASDGISTEKIVISFEPVDGAQTYALYYRKNGTSDEFVSLCQGTDTSYEFTLGQGTKEAGTVYDFQVSAIDSNGIETTPSAVETGCLLGPASLNATATTNTNTDSFTVSWDAVAGAVKYTANVYRDSVSDATYIGHKELDANGALTYSLVFSHVADVDLFNANDKNPYPLSGSYLVTIVPQHDEDTVVSEGLLTPVKGCWFGPPSGIIASKAEAANAITVKWNAVDDATKYHLYGSTDNATWKLVARMDESSTTATVTTTADTYYTVESANDSLTSAKQVVTDNSNYGYVLKAPESFQVYNSTDKSYFTAVWSVVPDAKGYVILDNAKSVAVDASTLVAGASSAIPSGDGYLKLDGKTITYCFTGYEVTSDPAKWLHSLSIASTRNDLSMPIQSDYSSEQAKMYRNLTHKEILNIVLDLLKTEVANANTQFSGDWWSGLLAGANKYQNSSGSVSILSATGTTQGKGGSITMTETPVADTEFKVSTDGSIVVFASDANKDLLAGNLGTDPLQYIEEGSLKLTLPACYGGVAATVKITTKLDVINKTGAYSVTYNGETKNFSYADVVAVF